MKVKKLLSITLLGILSFLLAGCGGQSVSEEKVIKVGVVGEATEQWDPIIETFEKEGIKIELVHFLDYSQPNQALADGEIDLNAFQHYAFLEQDIKDRGFELTPIGETILTVLGVYSEKIESLEELKEGAKIAIPGDATNSGRSLKLLEEAGVIKVDEAKGHAPTLNDITENPKNVEFIEVESAQTPRMLADVDLALITAGYAVDSGLSPREDALFLETSKPGVYNPFVNLIVARTEDKDNELYNRIVEEYRTDKVAKVIEEVYKGAYVPVWE
ncbi:MAG: MetQ/NlpA family ABC transporter substrate-binding protein [Clostridiales bacterium]|jgi:D-methionine transport system substrate-binding protein|nr:MetQ/NlpA family ABC transporter substrate-binding protein [Clostridiales bacterium]